MMTDELQEVLLAEYAHEDDMLAAAVSLLERGHQEWDVYAPFPCEAARLSSSRLKVGGKRLFAWLTAGGGLAGLAAVVLWIVATQVVLPDPMVNQGRMLGAEWWFGYVPLVFEGSLLGAGIGVIIGFFLMSRLGGPYCQGDALPGDLPGSATSGFYLVARGRDGRRTLNALLSGHPVLIRVLGKEVVT